ncbi:hypothetical protein ITJ38_08795 [Agreia pratensis]|uniref:hypothetical protein n=1 Tax=Agreia pratensis TaxID=150121 RepID=UPI00188A0E37|nr:hypothetical protein [Agreia pratensis]MBF4634495.1 hypothetical protein [Agreia pratensis]
MFGQKRSASWRHWFIAVFASGSALCLVGCGAEQLPESPSSISPSPTNSSSFFESDDEALSAGVDGYMAYLKMSDEITASGGADAQRIRPFVSEELFPSFVDGYESLMSKEVRSEGSTAIDSARLQTWIADDAFASVSFYLCVDVSQIRLFDNAGNDVTPPDRAPRIPILATVRVHNSTEGSVLTENEPWSGESFC